MERETRREESVEDRLQRRREMYGARDRESAEERQTRLERHRYAAMNPEQRCNLTQ